MSKENLKKEDAIHKLKDMIHSIGVGMLCTHSGDTKHVHAVPMSTQEVDDEGNIWFVFSSESESFQYLQTDNSVCLLYADPGSNQFLSIHGDTEIFTAPGRIDKYRDHIVKSWFSKDDPSLLVLKVIPAEAHYWDTKSNKLVTFFKTAISGITGQETDTGRCGNLEI
ncbi:MAG: pyridoxamine 5'-phosphate oxidase family protein [Taibaiella sp.]|nr:pyridoxamine 5'-phosphate oxidase family protein [Taibaiella sp.]